MSINDEVDRLLCEKEDKKIECKPINPTSSKPNRKYKYLLLGGINTFILCIVFFCLGGMNILPVFNKEQDEEPIQPMDTSILNSGDEEWNPEGEPYNYWYAPENSFGISQRKELNESYYVNWSEHNFNWSLYYKDNDWINCTEELNVTSIWNATLHEFKFILNFTSIIDEKYMITFDFLNESLLNYLNETDKDIFLLNYTVNNNETYFCYFNWSDVNKDDWKTKTKFKDKDNKTYFSFEMESDKKIDVGVNVSIDPNFGYEGQTGVTNCENYRVGVWGEASSSGTAQNMTAYINTDTAAHKFSMALYEYDDYGTNYAGDIIAYTEEKDLIYTGWITCNFSDPKPTITSGTKYYCMIWMELEAGNGRIGWTTADGYDVYNADTYDYPNWETPCDGTQVYNNFSVYCSYTESGGDVNQTQNIFNNWWTSGNVSSTQNIVNHYWTSGNLSTPLKNIFNHWWTSGNVTVTTKNIYNNWWTSGNTTPAPSQTQNIFNHWWTSGNTTDADFITVYPGWYWDIESDTERYGVYQVMNFSIIVWNESWIKFNTTSFNITAPNFINISLTFIDDSPLISTANDLILGFYANSSGGNVWFNLSGFENNANYYVTKNGTDFAEVTSNATGVIHFSDTVSYNRLYQIYNGTLTTTNNIFNNWWTSGNTSILNKQIFLNWWTSGNKSNTRNIFNNWWTSGNATVTTKQIFNYWWTSGNTTPAANVTQNIFNYYWTSGNKSNTQSVFNYWWTSGNTTAMPVTITDEYPGNGTNITDTQPTIFFTLNSSNGSTMDYYVYNGSTLLFSGSSVGNGTYSGNAFTAINYTTHNWKIAVISSGIWTNTSLSFRAIAQTSGGSQLPPVKRAYIFLAILAGVFAVFVAMEKRRSNI